MILAVTSRRNLHTHLYMTYALNVLFITLSRLLLTYCHGSNGAADSMR
jgi:hypothetical protein